MNRLYHFSYGVYSLFDKAMGGEILMESLDVIDLKSGSELMDSGRYNKESEYDGGRLSLSIPA